jgi:2'-hydroxyisoflavone reductase
MKKILILGGTQFIGRNVVERLSALHEYDITLFNRQKTHPELFNNCTKIKGDRETDDILQLTEQYWDFIIDLSCYYPNNLEFFLNRMKGKIGRYIFISTVSAYQWNEDTQNILITEDNTETLPCTEAQKTDTTMSTYGERKAECERVLLKQEWLDKIILRPCIVYGKYDHTDRFYYWLYKIHQQQAFVFPDTKNEKITLTYITDLVNIIVQSIDIKEHRIFYNTSTHEPFSLQEILLKIDKQMKGVAIDTEILKQNGITPGMYAPLWFGISLNVSNEKVKKDFNLNCIAFEQSIKDTQDYFTTLNWPVPKAGFDAEIESKLLEDVE